MNRSRSLHKEISRSQSRVIRLQGRRKNTQPVCHAPLKVRVGKCSWQLNSRRGTHSEFAHANVKPVISVQTPRMCSTRIRNQKQSTKLVLDTLQTYGNSAEWKLKTYFGQWVFPIVCSSQLSSELKCLQTLPGSAPSIILCKRAVFMWKDGHGCGHAAVAGSRPLHVRSWTRFVQSAWWWDSGRGYF